MDGYQLAREIAGPPDVKAAAARRQQQNDEDQQNIYDALLVGVHSTRMKVDA